MSEMGGIVDSKHTFQSNWWKENVVVYVFYPIPFSSELFYFSKILICIFKRQDTRTGKSFLK